MAMHHLIAPRLAGQALDGTSRFFAAHPGLHALGMAVAGAAAGAMAWRSLRAPTTTRAMGWAALAMLELDIAVTLARMPWTEPEAS